MTIKVEGLSRDARPQISWDRRELSSQQLEAPLLADPGNHELRGSAEGFLPVARSVMLSEGQKLEVVLAFAPADQATSPPPSTARVHAPAPHEPERRPSRALMWGSFGLAAVAVSAGTFSGIKSLSLTSDAKEHCSGNRCGAEAKDQIADAKTWANVSNVAFGVGVVAAGIGVWRIVTHRQEPAKSAPRSATIQAGVGLGEAWVGGSF